MKRLSMLILLGVLSSSGALRADPILDVVCYQNGNDVSLDWSVRNVGTNSGAVIYLEGYSVIRDSVGGQFVGWWDATSGSLGGTVGGGYAPNWSIPESERYYPTPSSRWDNVFTVGTHAFELDLFLGVDTAPTLFSPDGPYLTGPSHDSRVSLRGTYTVNPVPDAGATAGLLGIAVGCLWLIRRFAKPV